MGRFGLDTSHIHFIKITEIPRVTLTYIKHIKIGTFFSLHELKC